LAKGVRDIARHFPNFVNQGPARKLPANMSNNLPPLPPVPARSVQVKYGTRMTWLTAVACSLLIAGLWGCWASQQWGDQSKPRDPLAAKMYLCFAIAATVIIVPVMFLQLRSVRALASRGVTTQGRVEKISMFGRHGKSPTTVVYTVDGREYRIRRDLVRRLVEVGGTVVILYDPQKPKRCDILQ
jgi:hypothetical protein